MASISRQTFADWECVVVDDASRDGTASVVERARGSDGRFRRVQGGGTGLVPALHAGLQACRGRYVARMDADDRMRRDRLERQLAVLAGPAAPDAVGAHVRLCPRRGLGPGGRRYEAWINGIRSEQDVRREAFVECPVAHPTLMIRRDLLLEFGYRDLGWPEDYDLVLRLLLRGRRVAVVPRRLLLWRVRAGSLSRTHPAYRHAAFTACKAHFLSRGLLAGRDRYVLWGYGGTGRALRRELASVGPVPCAIVEIHPGRVGQRIHGAPVLSPDELRRDLHTPLVVSVARAPHRERIRSFLRSAGWEELRDFVCAA